MNDINSDSNLGENVDEPKAPGILVALGCLIPLYVVGSFIVSFFSNFGDLGLVNAFKNAFFQSHSPYFIAFMISFFVISGSLGSARTRSYERRGQEVPKSTAGIAIIAFLLAAGFGYLVDSFAGNPYAAYDECISDYLNTYWDSDKSEAEYACSSYLP